MTTLLDKVILGLFLVGGASLIVLLWVGIIGFAVKYGVL